MTAEQSLVCRGRTCPPEADWSAATLRRFGLCRK